VLLSASVSVGTDNCPEVVDTFSVSAGTARLIQRVKAATVPAFEAVCFRLRIEVSANAAAPLVPAPD
jgi:hypothetical protein